MANDVKHAPEKPSEKPQEKPHEKPMSEQATHQGGGGVNKDHKPHGGGPIPKGHG